MNRARLAALFLAGVFAAPALAQDAAPLPPPPPRVGPPSGGANAGAANAGGAKPVPAAPAPAATAARRDLRAGDVLSVSVLEHPELGRDATILADGTIDVPFVGRVPVLGRTTVEISQQIADGLKSKVRDPEVAVTVQSLAPNEFYVLGEVGKAGSFTVPRERRISLLQAFGMAGGLGNEADFTQVSIVPASGKDPKIVNATPGRSEQAIAQIVIENGDVIVVPAIGKVYVMGQVQRTGAFTPPAGEQLTLSRAIALAGGPTRLADEKNVLVTWRDRDGTSKSARFNLQRIKQSGAEDPPIFPGNLIVVDERIW